MAEGTARFESRRQVSGFPIESAALQGEYGSFVEFGRIRGYGGEMRIGIILLRIHRVAVDIRNFLEQLLVVRPVPRFVESVLAVQRFVIQEWQQQHPPTVPRFAVWTVNDGRWEVRIRVVKLVQRDADLLQSALAPRKLLLLLLVHPDDLLRAIDDPHVRGGCLHRSSCRTRWTEQANQFHILEMCHDGLVHASAQLPLR